MVAAGGTQRVPLREGTFTIPEDGGPPRLCGTRCPSCGATYAGQRVICLGCARRGLEPHALSPSGTVWTFTIVRQQPPGSIMKAPYPIGQVALDDGPIVAAAFIDIAPEDVRIGMPVEMTLVPIRKDDKGNEVVAHAFRRRKEAAR